MCQVISGVLVGATSEPEGLPFSIPSGSVRVIFDTDITGDVDDALALAMLHSLADREECEIAAITISKSNPLAPRFVSAMNRMHGRPGIAVGINPEAPPRESKYLPVVEERRADGSLLYPHDEGATHREAVDVMRQVLAEAADRSVVIVQVGLAVNVAALLESGPDEHSPLSGRELVQRKVNHLSLMAGAFTFVRNTNRHPEANVKNHVESMQALVEHWPDAVPCIWSDFHIGLGAPMPAKQMLRRLELQDPRHLLAKSYRLHSGEDHDRPTWDLSSVLFSVRPDRGYYQLSASGKVEILDDGASTFSPEKTGGHYLLQFADGGETRTQEAMLQLVTQPAENLEIKPKPRQGVILDTDMGNDIDDALALALLHNLTSRNHFRLLGVTSSKHDPESLEFIDAMNTAYERADLPLGIVREGESPEGSRFLGVLYDDQGKAKFPFQMSDGDRSDAVKRIRKLLANEADKSVLLLQVGFFSNLAALLESEACQDSPLKGRELIERKVKRTIVMGGAFQPNGFHTRHAEYNVKFNIPAAQRMADDWPGELIWSGFELGMAARYPMESILKDYAPDGTNLLREAYLAWTEGRDHNRPTWDLNVVLHASAPHDGYMKESPRGNVTVTEDGHTYFEVDKNGNDRYLLASPDQAARMVEAFVNLCSEPIRGKMD